MIPYLSLLSCLGFHFLEKTANNYLQKELCQINKRNVECHKRSQTTLIWLRPVSTAPELSLI